MNYIDTERINKFGKPAGIKSLIKHREDSVENWDAIIKLEDNSTCLLRQILSDEPDYVSWKFIRVALAEIGIKLPNRKDLKCDFYTQDATYYKVESTI